jgi:hypothetical protein
MVLEQKPTGDAQGMNKMVGAETRALYTYVIKECGQKYKNENCPHNTLFLG